MTLLWILHKIMEIICFSVVIFDVRQCNVDDSVVDVQFCF